MTTSDGQSSASEENGNNNGDGLISSALDDARGLMKGFRLYFLSVGAMLAGFLVIKTYFQSRGQPRVAGIALDDCDTVDRIGNYSSQSWRMPRPIGRFQIGPFFEL